MQLDAPLLAWYVPAMQGEHVLAPAVAYVPGAHPVQTDEALPPVAADDVPAAQAAQLEAPACAV